MKKYINISEVKNFTPTLEEYNKICIETIYRKGEGLMALIQEGKHEDELNTRYISFSFDMFWSKRARVLILPMKRKNQKQINEAEKEFFTNNTDQDLVNFLIKNK